MGVTIPRVGLEDGDSVVVDVVTPPDRSLNVSIAGLVRKPDTYPWHEGMTLKELVILARGPIVGADLREAEIAHLPEDRTGGKMAETVRVPMDSSYLVERDTAGNYLGAAGVTFPPAGSAPTVVLQPFDRVTIFQQPEFEFQRMVDIRGEVQHPGTYALQRKDERISDLVKRSGGLLPTAYVDGARLLRGFANAGRVDLRLTRAIERPGSPEDVILQPGDTLTIPEYNPTVRVEGAVNSPTSVLYQQGRGLDYYIANAGGWAQNADKGRVSVRYANGTARVRSRFLLWSSYPTPGPGSTVTVPVAPQGPPFNPTEFLGSLAQILASTVAILVIATKL
jgi:protein involved in polysaccharide export with SLBB domain